MRRKGFLVALALILGVGSLFAGDALQRSNQPSQEQSSAPAAEVESMVKKLTRAIDLWHDANLKNDRSKIVKYERMIFDVIQADVSFSREQVKYDRHIADSLGTLAVRERAEQTENIVRAKERLIRSLRNTSAFSNKYRLLADYVAVLKIEDRENSVELAEEQAQKISVQSEGEK